MRVVLIQALVTLGGVAALSWEVLWQLETTLAIGSSAKATALVLAATMAGITLGAAVAGRVMQRRAFRPIRVYGALELVIGCAGLLMVPAFSLIQRLDAAFYQLSPGLTPVLDALAIVLVIGLPTLAMGATIPAFARIARCYGTPLSRLYGMNTVGASIGVVGVAFLLLPALGVRNAAWLISSLNLLGFCASRLLEPRTAIFQADPPRPRADLTVPPALAAVIVFATGFVTFGLEVAWFRALRAAFRGGTESFAIMLAAVLIPLGIGPHLVPRLRQSRLTLGALLCLAGIAILVATPLVERIGYFAVTSLAVLMDAGTPSYTAITAKRLVLSLAILGPPMLLVGMVRPWLMEEHSDPKWAGNLYATNTIAAVLGSLSAGWILLPTLGFARTAFLLGAAICALAAALHDGRVRVLMAGVAAVAVAIAMLEVPTLRRDRIPGHHYSAGDRVLAYDEGVDGSVSVVESLRGARSLFIDGSLAMVDTLVMADPIAAPRYPEWMGRLPMLLHPEPARALVICFGVGQTANAVREEGPEALDAVDINAAVFEMAEFFPSNNRVLEDPIVRAIVMDGRAWLRRSRQRYDIVTLEPMPPTLAGGNALYSLEFYSIIADSLDVGGIVAQWLPLNSLPPFYAASAARTFQEVFPDSLLWMNNRGMGILLGRRRGTTAGRLGADWPGLRRAPVFRSLDPDEIRAGVLLDQAGLARYARLGAIVTDDNQLLNYGPILRLGMNHTGFRTANVNIRLLKEIAQGRGPARLARNSLSYGE